MRSVIFAVAMMFGVVAPAMADSNWQSAELSKGLMSLAKQRKYPEFAALVQQNLDPYLDFAISPDGCEVAGCQEKEPVIIDVVIQNPKQNTENQLAFEVLRATSSFKALFRRLNHTKPLRASRVHRLVVYIQPTHNEARWYGPKIDEPGQVEVVVNSGATWSEAKGMIEAAIKDIEMLPNR